MRPVDSIHDISQAFGSMATAGVAPSWTPNTVGWYVRLYGDYQPFGHAGADIACPVGTPVRAMKGGTVVWCDWDVNLPGGPQDWASRWFFYQRFGGRIVLIKHGPSEYTAYCHLSAFKVVHGQWVNEGELIGLSGDSAAGMDGQLGAHLHTERLVDMNYTTGGGLIYGRSDPSVYFTTISAQSSAAPAKKEGLFMYLTKEQELLIFNRIKSYIDSPISQVDDKVWQIPVTRGGVKVSALQELADSKTLGQENKLTLASLAARPSGAIDVVALAAQLAPLLTTNQAHQFIVALGQALPKE